jgi:hypothetical protein
MWRLVLALLVVGSTPAAADEHYTMARYACDRDQGQVTVRYVTAYNEAGRAAVAALGVNGVEFWSLVRTEGDFIVRVGTVEWRCELADATYRVVIGAHPGNFRIQGRCGAFMSGWVEIFRNGVPFPRVIFHEDCHHSEFINREVRAIVGRPELDIVREKAN